MLPSLLLAALAPAAPVPPGTLSFPAGPPPVALYLRADAAGQVLVSGTVTQAVRANRTVTVLENGKAVQKVEPFEFVQNTPVRTPFADLAGKFVTVGGAELAAAAAARRVRDGATVLVSADGKPVDPGWLRGADPETVVVTTEALRNLRAFHGGAFQATTPAPRLAMLAADPDGAVRVEVAPDPAAAGAAVSPRFVEPGAARPVPKKPLGEVAFEAYDLTGKVVPRADALKRLAGGGLVLIAGDNRLPDAAFLKAFRGDVLVLTSAELVLPLSSAARAIPRAAPLPAVAVPAVLQPAPVLAAPLPAPVARPLPLKPAEKK
jgi:hypothetical protein